MFLFVNKAWGYGDPHPDHYFIIVASQQPLPLIALAERLSDTSDEAVVVIFGPALTEFIDGIGSADRRLRAGGSAAHPSLSSFAYADHSGRISTLP